MIVVEDMGVFILFSDLKNDVELDEGLFYMLIEIGCWEVVRLFAFWIGDVFSD